MSRTQSYFCGCLVSTLVRGHCPWPRTSGNCIDQNLPGSRAAARPRQQHLIFSPSIFLQIMKDSPCLDRDLFVNICNYIHPETWSHHWVFELCRKDVIHTRVTEIRGADLTGVLTGKTEDGMASKCFLWAKALFCILPHYVVVQISSGTKPSEFSPSTARDVYASLRNYPDCSKRVDTWSSIKTAGQRDFFSSFIPPFFFFGIWKALLLLSICLKSFCSTLPQCLANGALKSDVPCLCHLRWRQLTGREMYPISYLVSICS